MGVNRKQTFIFVWLSWNAICKAHIDLKINIQIKQYCVTKGKSVSLLTAFWREYYEWIKTTPPWHKQATVDIQGVLDTRGETKNPYQCQHKVSIL